MAQAAEAVKRTLERQDHAPVLFSADGSIASGVIGAPGVVAHVPVTVVSRREFVTLPNRHSMVELLVRLAIRSRCSLATLRSAVKFNVGMVSGEIGICGLHALFLVVEASLSDIEGLL